MQSRMIGATLVGVALCACAADVTVNAPAPVPPVAVASGPFDGRYVGPIRLTAVTAGGGNCGANGETRTLSVEGNTVSIMYSPSRARSARGTVDAAGKVSADNTTDGMTLTGQIADGKLAATVTFTNGCHYVFDLTKQS